MAMRPGDTFAGYTLVRLLGSGSMGEVYLARHPRLPRNEALKILRPEISDDQGFQQRFIREADSIAALEHPNILTVHDRGEFEGQLWIATQFVDGTDAAQLLEHYPTGMPADEVSQIVVSIAQALDHAHDCGILHRDVKPANILLAKPDRDGVRRIYLADFGIARPLDDPAGLTSTNFTLGTVAYAAPEQLRGLPIDGGADQYALAATTHHLLTGTPVFAASNPIAVISHHLTDPPPAPSRSDAKLAPFDAAFARALAKNPDERFPRCQDYAREIAAATAAIGVGSPTARTQEAPVGPPPQAATPAKPAAKQASSTNTARLTALLGRTGIRAVAVVIVLGSLAVGLALWHPWATHQQDAPTSPAPTTTPVMPVPPPPTSPVPSSPVPSPPPASTSSPRPSPTTTPPAPQYPPAGALGTGCNPNTPIGAAADGTLYYCARMQYTDGYYWSRTADDIPNPNVTFAPPPPPSEVDPTGPKNGDPCTTLGVVTPGPWGLVECRDMSAYGLPGWFWGGPT